MCCCCCCIWCRPQAAACQQRWWWWRPGGQTATTRGQQSTAQLVGGMAKQLFCSAQRLLSVRVECWAQQLGGSTCQSPHPLLVACLCAAGASSSSSVCRALVAAAARVMLTTAGATAGRAARGHTQAQQEQAGRKSPGAAPKGTSSSSSEPTASQWSRYRPLSSSVGSNHMRGRQQQQQGLVGVWIRLSHMQGAVRQRSQTCLCLLTGRRRATARLPRSRLWRGCVRWSRCMRCVPSA